LSAPVDSLPLAVFEPDQSPEAVHDVELVADQLSVDEPPLGTVVGFAARVSVGGGKTITVRLSVTVPPNPVHESE